MNVKILIAVILLCMAAPSKATFAEATEYYEKEKYTKAFNEFKRLAEIGHKTSQFNLGVMYLEGSGVKQDFHKAYAWVKLSDEDSNKEKAFLKEIRGYIKTDHDLTQAEVLYKSLKLNYGAKAVVERYKPELKDEVIEKDRAKPVKQPAPQYPDRAQLSGIEGMLTVGLHVSPSGFPTDIRIIEEYPVKYFRRSTLKALTQWKFETKDQILSELYIYQMNYILGSPNTERLGELKQKAVDGDPKSQYLYGKYGNFDGGSHASKGISFNQNQWYFEAARNGVVNAQHKVADNLLEGVGCIADPEKAIAWLTLAASAGYEPSKFYLARLSFDKGNDKQGLDWLTQAFDTEDVSLSYKLVQYVFDNNINAIHSETLKKHLDRVMDKGVKNPVKIYSYYASYYQLIGDYDEATDYQEEAIEGLENLGEENIPQVMLDKLAYLKSKVS